MWSITGIGFGAPWVLTGLLALPVIWWLLRLTPPHPKRIIFPPIAFLFGLQAENTTPSKSPWWLTLLRLLMITALILAFARPVLNPAAEIGTGTRPVLIIVDNGWAAGPDWPVRRKTALDLVDRAADNHRVINLLFTARPDRFTWHHNLNRRQARQIMEATDVQPFAPQRQQTLAGLKRVLARQPAAARTGMDIFWISDGQNFGFARQFADGLAGLTGTKGQFTILRGSATPASTAFSAPDTAAISEPLGLYTSFNKAGHLVAHILRARATTRQDGQVRALNSKGQSLGELDFTLLPGKTATRVVFELPLKLRNQIRRLVIDDHNSAAAVHLLDGSAQWKQVALMSGESRESAQPLLSSLYYIDKALRPYARLVTADTDNLTTALPKLLTHEPSVIMLADIGIIHQPSYRRLKRWVERGGILVRFAGPRLEKGSDNLQPVRLRRGERLLGGALSWATPQKLDKFDRNSPFFGLPVPGDVTVSRQVLADPGDLSRSDIAIWARLSDGTPLVSARRLKQGWLVLYHVTASADWSNLPLSGLFVEQLRRILALAGPGVGPADDAKSNGTQTARTRQGKTASALEEDEDAGLRADLWRPFQVLDGFGQLRVPPDWVKPVARSTFATTSVSASHPPGYYGPPTAPHALNLITAKTRLRADDHVPTTAGLRPIGQDTSLALRPAFLLIGLLLLLLDSLIMLLISNETAMRLMQSVLEKFSFNKSARKISGLVLPLLTGMVLTAAATLSGPARLYAQQSVQPPAPPPGVSTKATLSSALVEAQKRMMAIEAANRTRLAYVITGNAEVDDISRKGLRGLSRMLTRRTAFEPAEPVGVDISKDELVFYPVLYWPVLENAAPLTDDELARIDTYMKNGGMIVFDTRDQDQSLGLPLGLPLKGPGTTALGRLLGRLNLPRLEPVPDSHVVTRSFYLLSDFPGRWRGGKLWVEAAPDEKARQYRQASRSDGVSSILITSNDFAAAWAIDDQGEPIYPVVPGGDMQREYAWRTGINIVMYALTGNYKADQVHLPALMQRLGQ